MDSSSVDVGGGSEGGNGVGLQADKHIELLAALDRLQVSFDSKIRYDETRDRQIAALHEELQEHRQGLYARITEPLLNELISLHDEVSKFVDDAEGAQVDGGNFAFLRSAIEEILARHGVSSFRCEGESVDRARQYVFEKVLVGDSGLDRRIARRARPGFELDGKILRQEWVVAYRYVATEG